MVFDRFQLFLSVVLVVLNGPTGDLPQILPRGFLGSTFGSERCALDTLDVHKERTTAAWGLFLSKKGGAGTYPPPCVIVILTNVPAPGESRYYTSTSTRKVVVKYIPSKFLGKS